MDFEKVWFNNSYFVYILDVLYYPATPPTVGDRVRTQTSTDAEYD